MTSLELDSVNGTYGANCTNRTGSWSVEIAGGAVLDHDELSVVLNDTACVLTMTQLRTDGGAIVAVPAIVLGSSYQGSASAFGDPIEFYANVRLSSVSFASNFTMTVLYSDDPSLASDDNTATFSVAETSASGQSVDAPDYTLDVTGILLQTDINDVVQSASGSAELTAGLVDGDRYVVASGGGLSTYAAIDAAYIAGTDTELTSSIPVADFALGGTDLTATQVRTLIIAHVVNDVLGYQAFEITFHPAIVD